jgi:CTP-dependent riboflavin kinase
MMQLRGRVQSGKGDASNRLRLFANAYENKIGSPVFPGSLNLNLGSDFDWYASECESRHIWFDRSEMGGERDVLLIPCVLSSLNDQSAFLWTTTTAARDRPDPWVVEIVSDVGLRSTFGLVDGDLVDVSVP